ncbi:MAG TPA: SEC-C metal-binding domain-containing protein, partial [Gaiellaceae bacterium]
IATNMAGRGTDILLGGNPDFLAKEILRKRGGDPLAVSEEERRRAYAEAKRVTEDEHRRVVELGGLHILGTERHESRRIDNQLRGRSGRQGDPGETRFYLSGEDELVRLFAGNRIYSIMDRFKLPEDQPMEAGILSRQIENAQKKVEEQNFVMRKNVLKYDDVMNVQRQVIYAQRRQVLEGEDMSELVREWIRETVSWIVSEYTQGDVAEEWDIDGLVTAMEQLYRTEITVEELREDVGLERDAIVDEFVDDALDEYKAKEEELEGYEEGLMRNLERFVVLQVVDQRWREHLENMEYLREGIHLRAMAQKDPLTEYRNEGYRMFDELNAQIRQEVVTILFHAEVQAEDAAMLEQPATDGGPRATSYEHETAAGADAIAASAGGTSTALASGGAVTSTVHKSEHENIGRNDPCWCGSGKKYKKCHGA